ncbi:hypothetical protein [Desulfoplanes formicivorans]|uniref:Uncharacterized protein n=1 Tax=Desulfoplanes formicivorans TaxID=1592317 RepID=A0A194ABX0_9BACT|nr:hypothetical protein [Desulfoplanes formicivorans]GAU07647.1 hypothetical protein DPF_0342 [Desulfoplanes formicivorans]
MSEQTSFTRFENQAFPTFRMKLGKAESTEDVKKFFFQTLRDLFDKIFGDEINFEREHIVLAPGETPCLHIAEALTSQPAFAHAMNDSDLDRVLERFAQAAVNRYIHLAKNNEKTNAKIRG